MPLGGLSRLLHHSRQSTPRSGLAEISAALALGRLDGRVASMGHRVERIFAARIVRMVLVDALRSEGHAFTGARFHSWFAGLSTLSDEPSRSARPPRTMCLAILTELNHSGWAPMAELARAMLPALLAPADHFETATSSEDAHQEVHAVLAVARSLLTSNGVRQEPDPSAELCELHDAIGADVTFTHPEPIYSSLPRGPIGAKPRHLVSRPPRPPLWALDLLWGERLFAQGLMSVPLPFPGLVKPMTENVDDLDQPDPVSEVAAALRHSAERLIAALKDADVAVRTIVDGQLCHRNTSRAPMIFGILAGFGQLRGAQLEAIIGASRLGTRKMLSTLEKSGLLHQTRTAGADLFSVRLKAEARSVVDRGKDTPALSREALDDYDTSMAAIDALLARTGAH